MTRHRCQQQRSHLGGRMRLSQAALLVALLTTGCVGAEDTMTQQGFARCDGETEISLETLYKACGAPGRCAKPLPCEQARCHVRGIVNQVNIWDQRTHPWLPSSKLLLESRDGALNLEAQLSDSVAPHILDKLQTPPVGWDGSIRITGRLIGVDLPLMGGCRRALVLIVEDPDALTFETGSQPTPEPL